MSFTVVLLLLLEFMLVTVLLSTACVLRNKHITPNIIIDIVAATLLLTTVTVAPAPAPAPASASASAPAPAVVVVVLVAIDLRWPWYCHTIILVVFISNIAINCLCGTRTKQADIMSL